MRNQEIILKQIEEKNEQFLKSKSEKMAEGQRLLREQENRQKALSHTFERKMSQLR